MSVLFLNNMDINLLLEKYEQSKLNLHVYLKKLSDEERRNIIQYDEGFLVFISLNKGDVELVNYLLRNGVNCRSSKYGECIHESLITYSYQKADIDNPEKYTILETALVYNNVSKTYFRNEMNPKYFRNEMNPKYSKCQQILYESHNGLLFTPLEKEAYKTQGFTDLEGFVWKLCEGLKDYNWKKNEKEIIRNILLDKFSDMDPESDHEYEIGGPSKWRNRLIELKKQLSKF